MGLFCLFYLLKTYYAVVRFTTNQNAILFITSIFYAVLLSYSCQTSLRKLFGSASQYCSSLHENFLVYFYKTHAYGILLFTNISRLSSFLILSKNKAISTRINKRFHRPCQLPFLFIKLSIRNIYGLYSISCLIKLIMFI